jgi:anti-sigma B factor antagonist
MRSLLTPPSIATLRPSGYISAANAEKFQLDLKNAVSSQENQALLVDMREVEFIDSAGIMALVSAYRLAQNMGRRMIICSLTPAVKMVFELTQLDRVMEIFDNHDTLQEAIA